MASTVALSAASAQNTISDDVFTCTISIPRTDPRLGLQTTCGKKQLGTGQHVRHGEPVVVLRVFPGKPASLDGRLQPGDQLLEVDGTCLTELTTDDANMLLRSSALRASRLCRPLKLTARRAPEQPLVTQQLQRRASSPHLSSSSSLAAGARFGQSGRALRRTSAQSCLSLEGTDLAAAAAAIAAAAYDRQMEEACTEVTAHSTDYEEEVLHEEKDDEDAAKGNAVVAGLTAEGVSKKGRLSLDRCEMAAHLAAEPRSNPPHTLDAHNTRPPSNVIASDPHDQPRLLVKKTSSRTTLV